MECPQMRVSRELAQHCWSFPPMPIPITLHLHHAFDKRALVTDSSKEQKKSNVTPYQQLYPEEMAMAMGSSTFLYEGRKGAACK